MALIKKAKKALRVGFIFWCPPLNIAEVSKFKLQGSQHNTAGTPSVSLISGHGFYAFYMWNKSQS